MKQYNELDITKLLIQYCQNVKSDEDHYLCLEAKYSANSRRADMLLVTGNNKTHAFEIKSDVDDLTKLEEQLKDYRKSFSFVSVVTTKKHIKNIRKILKDGDGLLLIDKEKIQNIRKAKERKKPLKKKIL